MTYVGVVLNNSKELTRSSITKLSVILPEAQLLWRADQNMPYVTYRVGVIFKLMQLFL